MELSGPGLLRHNTQPAAARAASATITEPVIYIEGSYAAVSSLRQQANMPVLAYQDGLLLLRRKKAETTCATAQVQPAPQRAASTCAGGLSPALLQVYI